MSSIGEISASSLDSEKKKESAEIDVNIYAYIFVDGLSKLEAQKKRQQVLERGIQIATQGNSDSGYTLQKWINPTINEDNGSQIEDDLHIHLPFFFNLEYGMLTLTDISNKSQLLKSEISESVEKYVIDDNVRSIRIHFLILCYNQLDILSNFINPVYTIASEERKKKYIKSIFFDKRFLSHSKITYKDVEVLISINPFGTSGQGDVATFATDSQDYKKIIKDSDEPIINDKINTPDNIDIQDAAVLCQVTYDSQSDFEQSIPLFVTSAIKTTLQKVKDSSAIVLTNIFNRDNLEILLHDTPLNFDSKESSAFSFTLISQMVNDVINDLAFFDSLLNIGKINTGTPSIYSGTLSAILKSMPDVAKKFAALTNNTIEGIKTDLLNNLTEELIEESNREREKEEKSRAGIIIYHDNTGFGLCNSIMEKGDTTYSIFDRVTDGELEDLLGDKKDLLIDASTGFYSTLYKKRGSDTYFYCTAGTNMTSLNDWKNNLSQGLFGISGQYTTSVKIAKLLDNSLKGKKLIFIGHSLGGGLASNNSLVTTRRHAITFNAAGLNFLRVKTTLFLNNRSDLFHPKRRQSKIHAYIIDGEILNGLLSKIGEGAYGNKYVIKRDESEDLWDLKSLGRHSLANTFLKLKRMDQISINQTISGK